MGRDRGGVSVNPSAPQAKLKLWRRAHLREQSIYVKGAKKSGGNFIFFFLCFKDWSMAPLFPVYIGHGFISAVS